MNLTNFCQNSLTLYMLKTTKNMTAKSSNPLISCNLTSQKVQTVNLKDPSLN